MSYNIPYLIGTPGANFRARTGFFFMGIRLWGVIFTFLCVPELSGRSLEKVDELYDPGIWAWQFEKTEAHGVGARIHHLESGNKTAKDLEEAEVFEIELSEAQAGDTGGQDRRGGTL